MEKREYTVNEIFENQILNEIYETRGDGLECFYIRMYGEPKETKKAQQMKRELENLMKKYVNDEEKQKLLWLKLDEYEGCLYDEMTFWDRQYYKFGFLDKLFLKREIEETKRTFFKNKENEELQESSFFYRYIDSIMQFLEDNRYNIWQKRKDYKETKEKMRKIKNKYPNVRLFIEDRVVIANLTKEELNAVLEYINLDDEIERIEKIETFKLGLKEGNWI